MEIPWYLVLNPEVQNIRHQLRLDKLVKLGLSELGAISECLHGQECITPMERNYFHFEQTLGDA